MKILVRVHEWLRRVSEQKDTSVHETVVSILMDCQQGAMELGLMVEEAEEQGHPLIALLEEYCEWMFRIYQLLAERNGTSQLNKVYKKLNRILAQIENSVNNDIKEHLEVVFLPYKASMWDSLESVWEAADQDELCDAYVIPVPYYDKNPDGSFRSMHYEGDQYPAYVSVTDYRDYDFAARRPDIVFIHNPYDKYNYVTSVEPFFYSTNLKQYTDMLVYIPYFVLGEIDPEDVDSVKSIENFCTCPGVFYSDKVIVQSENMRQIYIKVLMEMDGSDIRKNYWEQKISGLGSPKMDKVLNTKSKEADIPEEWLNVICREDGSRKKIIMYNNGVSALLRHNEYMITKIRDVLRTFKEQQEEVALLWRPHPLIEATISSLRPSLWNDYKKIVEQYQAEGWGIYDDSAELDRAILLSDGYYGDRSSVVSLYQKTEKPLMLQNVYALPENNVSLAMDNVAEYEGEWWFLAIKDSGIYRMNKQTFEASLVIRLPQDEDPDNLMPHYGKIYIYNHKIFVIPWAPVRIAVYDIRLHCLRYIDYEKECYNRGMVFCDGIINDNKLYVIPCASENLLCIDMDTEKVVGISLDRSAGDKQYKHYYAFGSVFSDGKNIYMSMLLENKIISFDMETHQVKVYQSELLTDGCTGICGDEENVWIIPRKADRIILWKRNEHIAKVIDRFPCGYYPGHWSFHKAVLCENYICLLPREANMCIVINRKTEALKCLDLETEKQDVTENPYDKYLRYSHVWEERGIMYIVNTRYGSVYCISEENIENVDEVCRIKLADENNICVQLEGRVERENRFENLHTFIEVIKQNVKEQQDCSVHPSGSLAWEYLKNEC